MTTQQGRFFVYHPATSDFTPGCCVLVFGGLTSVHTLATFSVALAPFHVEPLSINKHAHCALADKHMVVRVVRPLWCAAKIVTHLFVWVIQEIRWRPRDCRPGLVFFTKNVYALVWALARTVRMHAVFRSVQRGHACAGVWCLVGDVRNFYSCSSTFGEVCIDLLMV